MATNLLYTPRVAWPVDNATITAGSSVDFYVEINGAQCVAYQLVVYKVSDGSTLYDSTKVTLGSTLYDGDILTIPVTLAVNACYWRIRMYWDSTNSVYSNYYTCTASTVPTIVFSPSIPATITTPSYTFIGSYTQAENVLIEHWNISLYDSAGTTLLNTSDDVFSQRISYQFSGLLNGSSYNAKITGVTNGGVSFATALTPFTVAYSVPTTLVQPTATLLTDANSGQYTSAVEVDWGNVQSIVGVLTGTGSYVANWIYTGNYAMLLGAGEYITYTVDFTSPLTVTLVWQPSSAAFTGDIFAVQNTAGSDVVKFGYDGSKWYLDKNSVKSYTVHTLTTDVYRLAIMFDGAYWTSYYKIVA